MWGTPFATSYDVQYWEGEQPRGPDDNADDAGWRTFDRGAIRSGHAESGGDVRIRLAQNTVSTRWIRILMHKGSRTAPRGSNDVRDSLGFAIRELFLGRDVNGSFRELHASRHGCSYADAHVRIQHRPMASLVRSQRGYRAAGNRSDVLQRNHARVADVDTCRRSVRHARQRRVTASLRTQARLCDSASRAWRGAGRTVRFASRFRSTVCSGQPTRCAQSIRT